MSDKPKVVQRDAIHVNSFRSIENPTSDIVTIKEKIVLEDGTVVPHFYYREEVQRPFWVEKKRNQNYNDKKETRPRSEMDEFWCTQAELPFKVGRALGLNGKFNPNIRALAQNPYLYGTDCDVSVMVKRELDLKYADLGEANPVLSMAVLDYETNMFSEDEEIIMGSVTMKDKWLCAVDKNWEFLGKYNGEEEILKALYKYLGPIAEERGAKIEESLILVDSEIEIVEVLFERLHKLRPDVCSIWNITFDIEKTLEACERAGKNPTDVFCDPMIPEEYRTMFWKPDEDNKQKAGGQSSTKDVSDKWHWLNAPASFQFIDNMCLYRTLRAMEQKLPGYSLDAILETTFKGKVKKMKFAEADHIPSNTPEWHRFMQKKYPLEYIAYNIFDCVVMEILDEEIRDVSHKLYSYAGITKWQRVKSNPTRLTDAYHFFLLEGHDRVLCSTSNRMRHPFDSLTLSTNNWTVTLDNTLPSPKHMGCNPYEKDEEGNPLYDLDTKITRHAYDSDVSSSYPSNELAMNVSRDTTLVEVCIIDGLTEFEHRSVCVNLTNARGNAARIGTEVLGLPSSDELYKEFMEAA